jgi:hypothetical protein
VPGLPSYIDIETETFSFADMVSCRILSIRVESKIITPMNRHEHDIRAVVKKVLSSITLMNIPVEDKNLLSLTYSVFSCNRDVIEETKS